MSEEYSEETIKKEIEKIFKQLETLLHGLKDDEGDFDKEEALGYAE